MDTRLSFDFLLALQKVPFYGAQEMHFIKKGFSQFFLFSIFLFLLLGCKENPSTQLHGQVHLTLLHTSDIHSRLFPYNLKLGQIDSNLGLGEADSISNIGGIARISHIVGRERARSSRVIHYDGGDCFQGAPIFNFYAGEAEIRAMSAMGIDAMIIANHEFDKGVNNLGIQLQNFASFPVMAANYKLDDSSQPGAAPLGSIIQPFTVFDLDGLRVGFIGMGNLSSLTSLYESPNKLGITPLNTVDVAQFYVDLLRPLVDVVVFGTHLGLETDQRMIESTSGIDVVLGGHNHIVLQPPKHIRDCNHVEESTGRHYIELNDPYHEGQKTKRYCKPRDVLLAHSGAFAKYVGRLDLVITDNPSDMGSPEDYDPLNGFEVITNNYKLFPVNDSVPEDPIVSSLLEPYAQGLDNLSNLELLVGYAPEAALRNSPSGGDSPLGNMVASAVWLRLGIQTDFSLTNTLGIRADLVPGPVTLEQMFNIFPFDNSITKMQLSGVEVQDVFDFSARRAASRACKSQIQISGARVIIDCSIQKEDQTSPGSATHIYIGTYNPAMTCESDANCPGEEKGSCDPNTSQCWQPIERTASYELATSNYLAQGGSGFRVLQRNTTQFDTLVQQRDALVDYIRQGPACGADDSGDLTTCKKDSDCAENYVCACSETAVEGETCTTDSSKECSAGSCVLEQCRNDVAAFHRDICAHAPSDSIRNECETSLLPCKTAGEECKFLSCVDQKIGNFSDGRITMEGH